MEYDFETVAAVMQENPTRPLQIFHKRNNFQRRHFLLRIHLHNVRTTLHTHQLLTTLENWKNSFSTLSLTAHSIMMLTFLK